MCNSSVASMRGRDTGAVASSFGWHVHTSRLWLLITHFASLVVSTLLLLTMLLVLFACPSNAHHPGRHQHPSTLPHPHCITMPASLLPFPFKTGLNRCSCVLSTGDTPLGSGLCPPTQNILLCMASHRVSLRKQARVCCSLCFLSTNFWSMEIDLQATHK